MYETNYQMPVISRKDQAIRNFFSQPKFLWIGVLGFVLVFLSFFTGSIVMSLFDATVLQEAGFDTTGATAMSPFVNVIMTISIVIGSIPSALNSLAYLLLHLNAKKPEKNFNGPTTILNVLAIIGFVFSCIFSALFILFIIIAIFAFLFVTPSSSSDTSFNVAIVIFVGIVYSIPIAISILITKITMDYTSSLKKSATTDELSKKGVKGYSVILILNMISLGSSALSSILFIFLPSLIGMSPVFGLFVLAVNAVSFVQYVLMYQFVSGFGKIIEAEESTRAFELAQYYQQRSNPVTQNDTVPQAEPIQEDMAEVVEANLCKNCGNPVNDDDYFCMKCGTRIERD